MANGHKGGLHPEGGYRTADLNQDPPKKLSATQKALGAMLIAPVFVTVLAVIVAACVKVIQVCWAWIS